MSHGSGNEDLKRAGNAGAPAEGAPAEKKRHLHDQEQSSDESVEATADEYFEAYGDFSIHLLMLVDGPRVDAYAAAFRARRQQIEGKVVLDVGAGSGVLSLLAAKYGGAARVYAVEFVASTARLARDLVAKNGLSDVVRVLEGRAEDIELPEPVDVVVSEWMGFYLLHESMLDSVLIARDRWLKTDGIILPGAARIWATLVDAEELKREVEGFGSFHGMDFGLVGELALARRCAQPQVELVSPSRLLAPARLVWDLGDLKTLKHGATRELAADVTFVANRTGHAAGVAIWFDVGFGSLPSNKASAAQEIVSEASATVWHGQDIELSTSPGAPPTHWKQTVVYLGSFVPVLAGDVLPLHLTFQQSEENVRQYNITVET